LLSGAFRTISIGLTPWQSISPAEDCVWLSGFLFASSRTTTVYYIGWVVPKGLIQMLLIEDLVFLRLWVAMQM
jgi:hypothetical protein